MGDRTDNGSNWKLVENKKENNTEINSRSIKIMEKNLQRKYSETSVNLDQENEKEKEPEVID